VRLLRQRYPGVPVVTYVNTSAEVKAESDVCVTSGNAVKIVNALGEKRVIFLPDEYLAKYVASQTDVEIIAWKGHCEVHERFTGAQLRAYREDDPDLIILAHPECPPDVLAEADYVGSTQGMIDFVGELDAPSIPQGACRWEKGGAYAPPFRYSADGLPERTSIPLKSSASARR